VTRLPVVSGQKAIKAFGKLGYAFIVRRAVT